MTENLLTEMISHKKRRKENQNRKVCALLVVNFVLFQWHFTNMTEILLTETFNKQYKKEEILFPHYQIISQLEINSHK